MRLLLGIALLVSVFFFPPVSAAQQDLTIEFVGPWFFVPSQQGLIAIAASDRHAPAMFQTTQLTPGVYTLTLTQPSPGTLPAGSKKPRLVPVQATTARLKDLTAVPSVKKDIKGHRYALLLPPTSAFELPPSTAQMETSEEASISDHFAPIGQSPADYAKVVKVHYSVPDKQFTLAGKSDSGKPFPPITLSGDIKVSVDPDANALQYCDNHARYAFLEMITLLLEHQFVDFPLYTEDCRDRWDPQKTYQTLTQFESLRIPNLDRIDTGEIVKLIDQLKATTELFPADSEDQKVFEETRKYVLSWSNDHSGDYHKGLELGKKLKAILDRLRRLHEDDPKLDATRKLVSNRLDVLIGVVVTSWPSGRNCKAPMLTVTVTH